jgi:hypothetical protein
MPWTSTKSWAATADSRKPGSRTTGSEPCSTPASPTGASSPSSASAGVASCPRSPYGASSRRTGPTTQPSPRSESLMCFSMLPCGRPQQRPHECPHPWSGRRDRRAHVDPFIDRKSSQGRRSRGVRRVGRRALTARADSGGHNRCGRPVRAGLDAPRPLPVVSLVAPERVRRLGGAAWHCQCKCVYQIWDLSTEGRAVSEGGRRRGQGDLSGGVGTRLAADGSQQPVGTRRP